jgi:uncharacterized protein DUF1573
MEKSRKFQFGLSGIVCLLFVASLFVGCGGSGADTTEDARNTVATTPAVNVNNPATPTATKPAEPAAPVGPTTVMTFNELEFDYGVVDEGEKVKHVYKFKNTGSEPLIISNAKGSCGCTVPSWPKEPIPPGASGEIDVEFNSKGKKGKQSKRVTITANTDPVQTFLTIKGEVKGDPAADKGGVKPTSITPKSPSK